MATKRNEPERLKRGKAFHKVVQESWRRQAQGAVEAEKATDVAGGRKGRIDIGVDLGHGRGASALVEIKNSDWDAMTDRAVRRNVRRQIRQVWKYIEAQPNEADGVCPGIVFPRRPRDPGRLRLIEEMFLGEGIVAVWEDESAEECGRRHTGGDEAQS
jgi:hypothetical protein